MSLALWVRVCIGFRSDLCADTADEFALSFVEFDTRGINDFQCFRFNIFRGPRGKKEVRVILKLGLGLVRGLL